MRPVNAQTRLGYAPDTHDNRLFVQRVLERDEAEQEVAFHPYRQDEAKKQLETQASIEEAKRRLLPEADDVIDADYEIGDGDDDDGDSPSSSPDW